MYTNAELKAVIAKVQAGDDSQYDHLISCIYHTLTGIVCSGADSNRPSAYLYNATIDAYDSILDAIHDNLYPCVIAIITNYNPDKSTPVSYLYNKFSGLCKNKLRDNTRPQRYAPMVYDYPDHLEDPKPLCDIISSREEHLRKCRIMNNAIQMLPLKQQDVLEGYLRGESTKETADDMGISSNYTARLRASAVKTIRSLVSKDQIPGESND